MGITDAAVARLSPVYPDIGVIARRPVGTAKPDGFMRRLDTRLGQRRLATAEEPGPVVAVRLSVDGVRGGRSEYATARCRYLLVVDVSNLAVGIPAMWIRSPADHEIAHVNIWPSGREFCPWTGAWLPSLCWNTFATAWNDAPSTQRTLGGALEYAKQLLNVENHESPAR